MDAEREQLELKKLELVKQLAEVEVQLRRQDGLFKKVPHFNEIEGAGRELGQLLSRLTQTRLANEVAAEEGPQSTCPTCGRQCPTSNEKRIVTALDGPVELLEPKAHCSACRRAFFPSA